MTGSPGGHANFTRSMAEMFRACDMAETSPAGGSSATVGDGRATESTDARREAQGDGGGPEVRRGTRRARRRRRRRVRDRHVAEPPAPVPVTAAGEQFRVGDALGGPGTAAPGAASYDERDDAGGEQVQADEVDDDRGGGGDDARGEGEGGRVRGRHLARTSDAGTVTDADAEADKSTWRLVPSPGDARKGRGEPVRGGGADGAQRGDPRRLRVHPANMRPRLRRRDGKWTGWATNRFDRLNTGALVLASALLVLCTTVGAYVVSASAPTVYGARAELVYELGGQNRPTDADRLILTQLEVARSRAVLAPVAAERNISIADLDDALDVGRVGESGVLRFTVGRRNQEEAVRVAEGVVASYVRISEAAASREDELDLLTDRIAELDALLTDINAAVAQAIGNNASPDTIALLQLDAQDVAVRIADFEDRRTVIELEARSAARPATLTPAFALDDPIGPKPAQAGALGALAGMAIAASMAVAVAQLRPGREEPSPGGTATAQQSG